MIERKTVKKLDFFFGLQKTKEKHEYSQIKVTLVGIK